MRVFIIGDMRILAAADLHGSQYRLNLVLKNVKTYTPDLVVLCGDITQFGPAEVATNFIRQIPVQTLAVPGNIDSFDVDSGISAARHAINLHMRCVVMHGVPFVGLGRELPASLSMVEITNGAVKQPLKDILTKESVLVTHVPAYKLQDRIFVGSHGGSKALRRLIDSCSPRLVLCGHIHEDPGVSSSGATTVVNCSIGKRTEGALVEISEEITVKMLS